MNERTILFTYCFPGTLNANKTMYLQLPRPWTLTAIEAGASNATPATVVASGGATVAAAAIGSSGAVTKLSPTTPQAVSADTLVTVTLDYDGSSGTASADVSVTVIGLIGD